MRLYVFAYLVAPRLYQLHRGAGGVACLPQCAYEESGSVGLAHVCVDTADVE